MTEAGAAAPDSAIEDLSPAACPPHASPTTRRLLERIAAGPTGARLRMELARRHGDLGRDEIDDAFQEALQRALVACRGEREYEVYSFLRVTMRNCLSDGRLRAAREQSEENDGVRLGSAPDERPTPEAQLGKSEDRSELRELKASVLGRLGDRQRRVLAMRIEGLEVEAIAGREAASRKAIRKDIERIFTVGREEILRRSGFGCPEGHDLVSRYAFRLRADWTAAQLHIAGCERCSRLFANLDSWRERAAAVLPFPAAGAPEPRAIAHALERAGEGLAEFREKVAGSPGSARQHVSEAAGALKQQTAGALSRRLLRRPPLVAVRAGTRLPAREARHRLAVGRVTRSRSAYWRLVTIREGGVDLASEERERREDAGDRDDEHPDRSRQRKQHHGNDDEPEGDHADDQHRGEARALCGLVEVEEGIALHGGL